LAAAHGLGDYNAHNELADARMAASVLRLIVERAPRAWSLLRDTLANKTAVTDLLTVSNLLITIGDGQPTARAIVPLARDPSEPNGWLGLVLEQGSKMLN
jgi:exonuclease I